MNKLLNRFSWDDLKIIQAIGEYGNLSRASAFLDINNSTLFRRLGALEELLGLPLFLRTRTQYVPTHAGNELIQLAQSMKDQLKCVLTNVTEEVRGYVGEIRIATNDALLQDYLTPLIATFSLENPQISFFVSVGNEEVNLETGGADIAFRATNQVPDHLSGRKVGIAKWAIYGNKSEWEGSTLSVDQLKVNRWLGFTPSLSRLRAHKWIEANVDKERIVYRGDSVLSIASAIHNRMGIGLMPVMHSRHYDDLVRLSPVFPDIEEELWFLAHPEVRKSAKIREFINHCAEYIAKHEDEIFQDGSA
ncbi:MULTISPECIES: LysR family transcriptional regulator [Pantoea]|uniref:Transcriptional regulator, LysR family n=1 Tax=Candidatus Pantoea floridensis TaxID=1938870 RepID=A0A286C024_9GAMM|nr:MULTISPECIES: LysR family transcriptional regulator [Pantoea]PIF22231.1 LysR family transcriptional regulator [Enterobacteriaceae bacterium JKS000233]PXW18487.1 LysR family transcriptional regulator [Pantoea sp. JKS000250]SOD39738.1 transcriptional regulator, LysR family [Pantoea floridensis]